MGCLLIGCRADHTDRPSSLPLSHSERLADESVRVPEAIGKATERSPSAVLFVEFVATPQDVVERMLTVAGITKDDVVYDLGCGDGRIVVTAARRYGCKAVGYDLDPLRIQEARKNAAEHRVADLVIIEQKDVLKADLQKASVVMLYLGTEINARLVPQLEKLGPGARIVSHDFPLGDLPPARVVGMTSRADGRKHTIYLWTCPLPLKSP